MPVMSGFEAVKKLRQSPDLKDIPIVAISASVFEMDRKQSQIVGCDGFLPKPVEEDKLLEEIEEHLGVEWIYEERTEEPITVREEPVESLAPPQEELEQLYELAMLGNIYRIQERAKHLLELDKKYAQFANNLHKLARNFEDEQILDLIQKHLVLVQA
jgi:CheY-like chemotaxis protein